MSTNRSLVLESVVDTFLLHSDVRRKLLRTVNKRLKQDGEDQISPNEIFEYLYPKLAAFSKMKGYQVGDKVNIGNLLINYWFTHPSKPTTKVYFRDLIRMAFQNNVYKPNDKFIHIGTKVVYYLTTIHPKTSSYAPVADATLELYCGDSIDDAPLYPYFFDTLKEV